MFVIRYRAGDNEIGNTSPAFLRATIHRGIYLPTNLRLATVFASLEEAKAAVASQALDHGDALAIHQVERAHHGGLELGPEVGP